MSESAHDLSPVTAPAPVPAGGPLDEAIGLVEADLEAAEDQLGGLLQSTIAIIPRVGGHLAFAGGKRFRPLVTLLAAQATGHTDRNRIVIAAAGELLHTATLLHDDVIDGGEFRRGRPTTRLEYGNGMAVLTGDFCLARALQAVADTGHIEAVQTMSDAVTRMAEGEVAQLHVAGDSTLDPDRYYLVIDRKTAALIAWCASVAGLVGPKLSAALTRYGLELGYGFQIADDVLDYASGVSDTGKARGQDLREGKMTLPLILACQQDANLHREVCALLDAGPPVPDSAAEAIIDQVVASGALDRARQVALDHADRARAALGALPPTVARDALANLADYVARRSN